MIHRIGILTKKILMWICYKFLKRLIYMISRTLLTTMNTCQKKKKDKQFIKDNRLPSPQYHLESSQGKVKNHVTALILQTHFDDQKLKDFSLSSKLKTGISIVNNLRAIVRLFLADAKLPKKFWFRAIRKAALRSNKLSFLSPKRQMIQTT